MQHEMQHEKEKALEIRAKTIRLVGLEPIFNRLSKTPINKRFEYVCVSSYYNVLYYFTS